VETQDESRESGFCRSTFLPQNRAALLDQTPDAIQPAMLGGAMLQALCEPSGSRAELLALG